MNDQERQEAFLNAINDAAQLYGFNVAAVVETETLGPIVQCRGRLQIVPVPNWQPPQESPIGDKAKLKDK